MHTTLPADVVALLGNPDIRNVIVDYGITSRTDGTRGCSVAIVTRGTTDATQTRTELFGPTRALYDSIAPAMADAGYRLKSSWDERVRGSEGGAEYFRPDDD